MRFNLAKPLSGRLQSIFFTQYIKGFTEEYDIKSAKIAIAYVKAGKESVEAFVQFLKEQGFTSIQTYYLPAIKTRLNKIDYNENIEVRGDDEVIPSYGFTIAEDDPKLVEFKLKYG